MVPATRRRDGALGHVIVGVLVVLALAGVGGRLGFEAGNWWADNQMDPADGLGEPIALFVWTAAGVVAGSAVGLGIAYVLGKGDRD